MQLLITKQHPKYGDSDIVVDLSKRLFLITGENNSGKTTIATIIQNAFQNKDWRDENEDQYIKAELINNTLRAVELKDSSVLIEDLVEGTLDPLAQVRKVTQIISGLTQNPQTRAVLITHSPFVIKALNVYLSLGQLRNTLPSARLNNLLNDKALSPYLTSSLARPLFNLALSFNRADVVPIYTEDGLLINRNDYPDLLLTLDIRYDLIGKVDYLLQEALSTLRNTLISYENC